jgi:hypothetical protein
MNFFILRFKLHSYWWKFEPIRIENFNLFLDSVFSCEVKYPFNTFWMIWEMWVEGANPNTPKTPSSHSWGRFLFFSAHISQIIQKVLKGYVYMNLWSLSTFVGFWPSEIVKTLNLQSVIPFFRFNFFRRSTHASNYSGKTKWVNYCFLHPNRHIDILNNLIFRRQKKRFC